jgi:hypothetical protein
MATGSINNKSKQVNVRVPHEVLEDIESVKDNGEYRRFSIVAAMARSNAASASCQKNPQRSKITMAKITRNQAIEIIKNYFLPLEVIDDGNTNEGDPISFVFTLKTVMNVLGLFP